MPMAPRHSSIHALCVLTERRCPAVLRTVRRRAVRLHRSQFCRGGALHPRWPLQDRTRDCAIELRHLRCQGVETGLIHCRQSQAARLSIRVILRTKQLLLHLKTALTRTKDVTADVFILTPSAASAPLPPRCWRPPVPGVGLLHPHCP